MKQIRKFIMRTALLMLAILALVIILVTQPVFSGNKTATTTSLVSVKNLKKHVYMLSDTIHKKTPQTKLLETSAAYIFAEISSLNQDQSYQNYGVNGINYKNIVVKFSGTKDCGVYVVGAHYDTYSNYPGADDNNSGVAGLIELVRLFSIEPPKCDLHLVFYTLEEPPYFRSEDMGSYIHAKSLYDAKINVEMMIAIETIGYFSDEPNSQNYPIKAMQYVYSNKGNFISIVGNMAQIGMTRFLKKQMRIASDLPIYSINAPALVQGIDFSDHLNYWRFGFPGVMITDTAFNRNKNYHTENDTADKLDYKRMGKVIDGVFYALNAHMQK